MLKAELCCRTWAELLSKLVESQGTRELTGETLDEMKNGVAGFLQLRTIVSQNWKGHPGVVEDMRKSKRHDDS